MAGLLKEVWLTDVNELLYPENSVLRQSQDLSEYADNNVVHIPNAGVNVNVVMNRAVGALPGTAVARTDNSNFFYINSYSTDPMICSDLENHQISYDKRHSLIYNSIKNIETIATNQALYAWALALQNSTLSASSLIFTSGISDAGVAPVINLTGATASGARSAVTISDIFRLKTILDNENVPDDDKRVLLVPANEMNNVLIQNSNILQAYQLGASTLAVATLPTGALSRIAGMNIYTRPTTLAYTTNAATGTSVLETMDANGNQPIAATDNSAILAWHPMYVAFAKNDTKMFVWEDSPLYYGTVLSFDAFMGGSLYRLDAKGFAVLVQKN